MADKDKIRTKAMCLLMDKRNRVLLGKGYDSIKKENFYRVLGGSLNFGETAENGVRREIREELHYEIERLKHLEVIENLFEYDGKKGHEIVFLFQGEVSQKSLEQQKTIHIVEDEYEYDAEWIPVENILKNDAMLYPAFDYAKFLRTNR